MNVCLVAYTFYERDYRVRRYAETLARRGDIVDVVALRTRGQPRFETINGVRLHRIQRRTVNETSRLKYLFKLLLFLVNSAVFLTRRHLRARYDIIHIHSVPDFEVFAASVPKFTGAKIILDIHDILPEFYASKFGKGRNTMLFRLLLMSEKASCAFSDHVIIANHIWHGTITSRSVGKDKCTAIINYPDLSIFSRTKVPSENRRFVLLYPGTLNRHQGLDVAVRGLALIKEEIPEAVLHIYGSGDQRDALAALASERGIADRVVIRNPVPLEEIARVMAGASVGIVPKRDDSFGSEAFSTKILEFMAVGIPVVASRTKIDSLYFDDSLVLFFDPGDERSLAECLLALRRDRDLWNRLAANGLRYVAENNWRSKEHLYLEIIESLTTGRRGRPVTG